VTVRLIFFWLLLRDAIRLANTMEASKKPRKNAAQSLP
jgi:hypothetical protein